jgi:hypothetical protein
MYPDPGYAGFIYHVALLRSDRGFDPDVPRVFAFVNDPAYPVSGKIQYLLKLICRFLDVGNGPWLGKDDVDPVTCRKNTSATVNYYTTLRFLCDDRMLLSFGILSEIVGKIKLHIK